MKREEILQRAGSINSGPYNPFEIEAGLTEQPRPIEADYPVFQRHELTLNRTQEIQAIRNEWEVLAHCIWHINTHDNQTLLPVKTADSLRELLIKQLDNNIGPTDFLAFLKSFEQLIADSATSNEWSRFEKFYNKSFAMSGLVAKTDLANSIHQKQEKGLTSLNRHLADLIELTEKALSKYQQIFNPAEGDLYTLQRAKREMIDEDIARAYYINTMSKQLLLMGFGTKLKQQNPNFLPDKVSGAKTTVSINEYDNRIASELKDPAKWQLMYNLHNRSWMIEVGKKIYYLKEKFDIYNIQPMGVSDTRIKLSNSAKTEADIADKLSQNPVTIISRDNSLTIEVQSEKPIASLEFSKEGDVVYSFGIYEELPVQEYSSEENMSLLQQSEQFQNNFKDFNQLQRNCIKILKKSFDRMQKRFFDIFFSKETPKLYESIKSTFTVDQQTYARVTQVAMKTIIPTYIRLSMLRSLGCYDSDSMHNLFSFWDPSRGKLEVFLYDTEFLFLFKNSLKKDIADEPSIEAAVAELIATSKDNDIDLYKKINEYLSRITYTNPSEIKLAKAGIHPAELMFALTDMRNTKEAKYNYRYENLLLMLLEESVSLFLNTYSEYRENLQRQVQDYEYNGQIPLDSDPEYRLIYSKIKLAFMHALSSAQLPIEDIVKL